MWLAAGHGREYSPTTLYKDYAIPPTDFHWESQSTTTQQSKTGQRIDPIVPHSEPQDSSRWAARRRASGRGRHRLHEREDPHHGRRASERTRHGDLGGRSIIPGLNETHIHVRDLGFEQHVAVNLEPAAMVADVQRMLRERLTAAWP